MYYPEEVIEEVRTRNDIVDIVSQYVNLKKKRAQTISDCARFIMRNPRPFPFHRESRCITASDAEQAEMSSPL